MFPTTAPPRQRLLVFATIDHPPLLDSVGESTPDTEIEVMWAPTAEADGESLRRAFGDRVVAMQTGATLGDRLNMAFSERFFFQRTEKIIAIGTPIERATIDHAFALLDSLDWVIGPAADGGAYLIGCRGPAFDSEIFMDSMKSAMERIRATGSTVAALPAREKGFEE
jgi:glycosyltransferase A (GT-A) superfamily protein (DUF2064 family)